MKLSEELKWRGFLNQTTINPIEKLDEEKFKVYLGTDPSGNSLHVGHLAVYMLVRRLLDHGHEVVLLVGGGTGMVGDPRDTEERNLLSLETIEKNKTALAEQVSRLFGGQNFTLVDNYDWLKDLNLLEFLRDTGKHFPMNMLLDRDAIKTRLGEVGSGMSYAEFSYTLLQGYDYWHLSNNFGVNLQIGGSDQWGNILSGVELIRRKESKEAHAMTAPLVVDKTTGRKFGKSEAGHAIWLDPNQTTPYDFYQFWFNIGDESVEDYLKMFTLLDQPAVESLMKDQNGNPSARPAQKALAFEVTKLVHGENTANSVVKITQLFFGDTKITDLTAEELDLLAAFTPTAPLNTTIVQALTQAGIATSNSEANKLIAGNAISLNGTKIATDTTITDLTLLKKGKNQFILVR